VSIRLRLTLLYSLILVLVLVAFSLVVYRVQFVSTTGFVEHRLSDEAERLAKARQFMLDSAVQAPAPWPSERSAYRPPISGARVRQLRTLEGKITVDPPGHPVLPLSYAGVQAVRQGHPWSETATIEGEQFLIASEPVVVHGQIGEIVQVAQSLAEGDSYLHTLRENLLIASAIATLIAFAVGWVLAGFVLRPIHSITRTARSIAADKDLSRRVSSGNANDEIGQLAMTFNAMLGELHTAYQQIGESLQQQRRFVADVSHELRTPLTTLRGNIELLRREPPISAEDRKEILGDMATESQRLIRLVRDLLAMARADAHPPLRSEAVRIGPLLEEVCGQARLLDPARAIDCAPAPEVTVLGDAQALRQVLLILLDNAIQHAAGRVAVEVHIGESTLSLSVRDEGPGIPADVQAHLFERFYRGERDDHEPGSGLGLAIAKSLVEAQKGSIAVESQVGSGSVFTVTLPLAAG
jgi:two-component system, OmpR family, sensor kinase